jgi:hypothetical protein
MGLLNMGLEKIDPQNYQHFKEERTNSLFVSTPYLMLSIRFALMCGQVQG